MISSAVIGVTTLRGGIDFDGGGSTYPRTHADKSCDGSWPFTLNVPMRIL